MAEAYEGKISTLEYEVTDNSYDQKLRKLANWLLFTGKRAEKKGSIDKSQKFFRDMVNEIDDNKEEFAQIEKLVFDQIENYIKKGTNGKYTFECNDICTGTLKYFEELHRECKNLDHTDNKRLKELINNINKVSVLTATKGEAQASPKDLKDYKGKDLSKVQYKNKKVMEDEPEEDVPELVYIKDAH